MSDQTFIKNHILMDVEAQSPLPTGGHKMLSREEWLKLKPIIKQLYIDEEQTYPAVARELARRFEFYPTRRQFTRKTEEWGLKKNFRKAERKLLLQNDKKGDIAEFVVGDKRVSDPKRIQRLKRRYAHESPLPQVQLVPSYQDINAPPISDGPYCSLEEQLPISNYVVEIASAHVESTTLDVTEESSAMDLEQLPFSGDNDIHGSLGLTRLFQRLEIEASKPPLNLDDDVLDTKQFISGNELRNDIECHATPVKQMSAFYSCAEYGVMPNTVVQHVPISGKVIQWSPLFELDLFPTSQYTRGHRRGMMLAPSSGPLIDVWEEEIKEWKFKLRTLRMTLPDHNPAIILVLQHLIHLYKQTRKFSLRLYHQLLAARLKEACPNKYKIMDVYFEIVMQLLLKGKVSDAAYLHRSLRGAVQQSQLGSEHPFHIRFSYLEAYVSYRMGQYGEAESIIRLVIQKVLNNQNLYRNHRMISDALQLLGVLMKHKKEDSYSEIEKLCRYNIHQFIKQGRSLDMAYFESMKSLISALMNGQKIEEAHSLCIYIMECVELTLGRRHFCYNRYRESLGHILYKRGMVLESIEYFYSALLGVDKRNSRSRIYQYLGYALIKWGNIKEAIVMFKKSLSIEVQRRDWRNCSKSTLERICGPLGRCYEELSQFRDALFLYGNLLGKVKSVTEDENPFIKKVKGWISRVQDRMEESSASSEDDGSGDTDSSLEVQMGDVDDDLGYGQFSDNLVHDVSLREIFEIEDKELDEKIADISKQISSVMLS